MMSKSHLYGNTVPGFSRYLRQVSLLCESPERQGADLSTRLAEDGLSAGEHFPSRKNSAFVLSFLFLDGRSPLFQARAQASQTSNFVTDLSKMNYQL